MMTPEQQENAERLQRYIERKQLVSCMNQTKWEELFRLLEPTRLSFRTKDVQRAEPSGWHGDLYYALSGTPSIEWLELDAKVSIPSVEDDTPVLRGALDGAGIPYSIEDGCVRIWGYLRPGVSPRWAEGSRLTRRCS